MADILEGKSLRIHSTKEELHGIPENGHIIVTSVAGDTIP